MSAPAARAPVAFLGTGLMGRPMIRRLVQAGHPVVAWNRTASKAEPLRELGVRVAATAADAVTRAQVVVLMLTDAAAIRAVLLDGPVRGLLAGRTVIQMGTIAPSESRALAQDLTDLGGEYLEAPVLGSIPEAEAGTLIVMAGAAEPALARWRGLLAAFGEVVHVGEVGQGAALKLAMNQLIAAETAAFALSLALAEREGVPVETFMEVLRASALYAPTFDKKLERMLAHRYGDPNFPTRHLLKDVELFLSEAERLGLDAGPLAGVRALLRRAIALGHADDDYSALREAVLDRDG